MKKNLLFSSFIIVAFVILPARAQWKNAGYDPNPIIAFGVHDSSLFLSGGGGGIWRYNGGRADAGIDFTQGNITSFASIGRYFFAGQTFSDGKQAGEYSSMDNGTHWSEPKVASPVISNGTYLFGGWGNIGVARSLDSGKSWDSLTNLSISGLATLGTNVFLNTGSSLWRSTNNGLAWFQLAPPFIGNMTVMGSLLLICADRTTILLSRDNGSHWSTLTVDTGGEQEYVTCLSTDGETLFAGTKGNGVLVSSDTGVTWKTVNAGLPLFAYPLSVGSIGVFDTLLFADLVIKSVGYNLFVCSIPAMVPKSGVKSVAAVPVRDTLEVFPNPASGLVTIRGSYSLERVSVLNVLGAEVLNVPSIRASELTLDLSRFASGTYFLRILSANGTVMRKVVRE